MSTWQSSVEPTATSVVLTYPFMQDAGGQPRSTATYNATLGGAATLDAFLTEEKRQSSLFWRPSYSSATVGQYLKRGFDIGGPSASLSAQDLTDGGAPTATFSITYSDNDQIKLATIDGSDVRVTGPGGYDKAGTLVGVTSNANGSVRTATYSVPAPNGTAWDSNANGSYAVTLQLNAVSDASGTAAAGGTLGSFNVAIDPAAPTADLSATNVTSATSAATLTVLYTAAGSTGATLIPGNAGFETPALGSGAGAYQYQPDGASWGFFGNSGISANSTDLTAGNPNAPGGQQVGFLQDTGLMEQDIGGFQDGTYVVSFKAAQRQARPSSQRIEVLVDNLLVGTITPSATTYASYSTPSFDVEAGTHTVTLRGTRNPTDVAFIDDLKIVAVSTDNNDIDVSSVDDGDLRVTGPNGFSAMARFDSIEQAGGTSWLATYLVDPPAGGWTNANNGAYTVSILADEVFDTNNVPAPAGPLGTFTVNIPVIVPPSAAVSAPTITTASSSAEVLSVTYTDDTGINTASIAGGNLTVLGPNNFIGSVTAGTPVVNGSSVTVPYTLNAPAGTGWLASHNGLYSVVAQSSPAVTDTTGTPLAAGTIGTFVVNIDGYGPEGWEKVGTITAPLTSGPTITVTLSDDTGIDTTTLDNSDLSGTRIDNAFTVGATFQSFVVKATNPANGKPTLLDATYVFNPPGGQWQVSNGGVYNIFLRSGQVADVVSPRNFNGSQYMGVFVVNLEKTAPTVSITAVTPDPRATPVTSMTITFSEAIKGFDLADLSLTRDGGANLLSGSQTLTTSDGGITWTLGNLSGITTTPGSYALTLTATGSGITDLSGNALASGASTTWTVSTAAAPVLASAASRLTHGAGGPTYDLGLPTSGTAAVESRNVANGWSMVLTFDKAITSVGSALVTSGIGTAGTVSISGNSVIVAISGAANQQSLTLTLSNIQSSDGGVLASAAATVRLLKGDVNGDGSVNISDINLVKAASGQPLTLSNFRKDVNGDGAFNISDINLTKAASGTSVA